MTKLENGCNCYVLHNETAGVLIDTGLNSKADEIIKLCKEKRVKMMILTHGHVDHVQCAAKVAKELDIDDLYESAKKISATGDMTICFGHGNAVKNRNWMND